MTRRFASTSRPTRRPCAAARRGARWVLDGGSRGRASAGYSRVLERVLTGTRAGTRRVTRGKRKGGRLDQRVLRGYSGVLDHGDGDGDEDAGAVVRRRRALRRQRCTTAQGSSSGADRTATERCIAQHRSGGDERVATEHVASSAVPVRAVQTRAWIVYKYMQVCRRIYLSISLHLYLYIYTYL
jgi:hypothetical protein